MSFQSAYSSKKSVLPEVVLLSAGEDQLVICSSSTIFLEAVVDNPANLPGHTTEWEQLEGALETLTITSELTANYPFIDKSDKVFRFWIDKGRPQQQYKDVRIYHTPTSICSLGNVQEDYTATFQLLYPEPVHCDDITYNTVAVTSEPTTYNGIEPLAYSAIQIDWEHPRNVNHRPHVEQYIMSKDGSPVEYVNDQPILTAGDGDGPPTEPRQYTGLPGIYQLRTLYNIMGKQYDLPSCELDLSSVTLPLTVTLNDTTSVGTTNPEENGYVSLTRYKFISVLREDTVTLGNINRSTSYSSVTRYAFIAQSGDDITSIGSINTETTNSVSITRTDFQGIGGN